MPRIYLLEIGITFYGVFYLFQGFIKDDKFTLIINLSIIRMKGIKLENFKIRN